MIIIRHFGREGARRSLAIEIISTSLSYTDSIKKLIQLVRELGVRQSGNSDITGYVLHVGRLLLLQVRLKGDRVSVLGKCLRPAST